MYIRNKVYRFNVSALDAAILRTLARLPLAVGLLALAALTLFLMLG